MTAEGAVSTGERRLEILISVAETACDNAAKHYDDYYKTFAALDGKAQAAATVSGILLASVVAFVNAGRLSTLLSSVGTWGYLLVLSPAVGALVTVIVSFVAAKVMKVAVPFSAPDQLKEVGDLADLPPEELSKDYLLDYYRDRLTHWKAALADIAAGVERKARLVLWTQALLVLTVVLLLILVFAMVASIQHSPLLGLSPS